MAIDLHLHTQASDGTWTPAELVRKVQEADLTAFAVTDHDVTAALAETARLVAGTGLTFIPGVRSLPVIHRILPYISLVTT